MSGYVRSVHSAVLRAPNCSDSVLFLTSVVCEREQIFHVSISGSYLNLLGCLFVILACSPSTLHLDISVYLIKAFHTVILGDFLIYM